MYVTIQYGTLQKQLVAITAVSREKILTRDEFDFWPFVAFASCRSACAIPACVVSMLESMSSNIFKQENQCQCPIENITNKVNVNQHNQKGSAVLPIITPCSWTRTARSLNISLTSPICCCISRMPCSRSSIKASWKTTSFSNKITSCLW